MNAHEPADPNAIIPADTNSSLTLPSEMVNRGLALATKLETRLDIQDYQTPLRQCPASYNPACISFSADGKSALITAFGRDVSSPIPIFWNASDGSRKIALMMDQDPAFVHSGALSRNGDLALLGYNDGHVLCWDVHNGRAKYIPPDANKPPLDQTILAIKFSPDQTIKDERTSAGKKYPTKNQPDHPVTSIAFAPDERFFAECIGHLHLRIREIDSGREIQRFPTGYLDYYNQMAYSHDGRKIVVAKGETTSIGGGMQSLIIIFDLAGKQKPLILLGSDQLIAATAVVFFPDSQMVASLDSNGRITIWNARDGSEIMHWSHVLSREDANDLIYTKPVTPNLVMEMRNPMVWGLSSVAVSPDGSRILSGGGDTFMRLWTLDGHLIHEYPHPARVVRVGFSADGRQTLSGCWDGSVYAWRLPQ